MIIDWVKRMHEVNCVSWKYGILVGKGEDTERESQSTIGVYRSEQKRKLYGSVQNDP
jgi:hypothetical protein